MKLNKKICINCKNIHAGEREYHKWDWVDEHLWEYGFTICTLVGNLNLRSSKEVEETLHLCPYLLEHVVTDD